MTASALTSLFSDAVRNNPYPLYQRLRDASPVLRLPEPELYLLLGYDDVKRALHDHETFGSGAAPSGDRPLDWLIFLDPPRHAKLRAIIVRAFTPRSVASLEPRIREITHELLDAVIPRGEMDLASDFAIPLPLMVIAEMLGIPTADLERYRRWADTILNLSQSLAGGEAAARAVANYSEIQLEIVDYLKALPRRRKAAPGDDLLTRVVEAEVDGDRLDLEEVSGFFQLLLLAGSETTTNLIDNAMLCFLDHPGELARLRATPELLAPAIEEVLRYRAPVQAVFRVTRREIEIGDQRLPRDKLVLALVGSANRDPRVFPSADRFDIGRDPNPHVAFGHGIHFCLGASLARLEARIAIPELLRRLPRFERTSSAPWEPRAAFHVHGPARLPIRFDQSPAR